MVLDPGPESPALLASGPPMRGVHAGLIVFGGVLLANLGNYGFQLISARELGPASYSDLATLLAIVAIIGLPLGGVQLWIARHVAEYDAVGEADVTRWFMRRSTRYATLVAVTSTVVLLALSGPLKAVLGIGSLGAVAATALITFPAVLTPVVWGLAQGLQRFALISVMVASAPLLRIVLAVGGFATGFGVFGAMSATLVSNLVTLIVPIWLLRRWFSETPVTRWIIDKRTAVATLFPVLVGLLAITALTTIDVVVAKRTLTDHSAGIYGSASLVGRVILYLPTAIITVLLPRVAARTADRRESLDLLGLSVAVTAGFCVLVTAIYAVASHLVVRIAFGSDYLAAAPLLWRFGVAMTCFSLLNVLFVYHLGRRDHSMSWILGIGAVCQLVAFAVFHDSAKQLVDVDIVVAGALLVAHELATGATLTMAIRASLPWARSQN